MKFAGLAGLVALTAALYLGAGTASAYLAADDFQFLVRNEVVNWSRLLHGDSFYRPVIDVWFSGAARVCGPSVPCYHFGNLALHLINIVLVFALTLTVLADVRPAFLTAALFAVQPAPIQAVVWVSAVTSLLATSCYLSSLLAQARSWRMKNGRVRYVTEAAALLLFAAGVYSHEAAITLPVIAAIMWYLFAPQKMPARLWIGLATITVIFAVTTIVSNRRNDLFAESYTIGPHNISHFFQYLVSLFVAPRRWPAYLACTVILQLLLLVSSATRFGALWLIVSLTPYVGFTTGNVSRYMYLPAVGFAWMVGSGLVVLYDWIARSTFRRTAALKMVVVAIAVFLVVRSSLFCLTNTRREVTAIDKWRSFTERIIAGTVPGETGTVRVTVPSNLAVEPWYIEPIVRWSYQNPRLTVIVAK